LRGECGGGKIYSPVEDSPVDKLLEKTSPGALEPKKSPYSLKRYELFKVLYAKNDKRY